jgi:RNA polymerase sigma-70 factor (ECF subfamily)
VTTEILLKTVEGPREGADFERKDFEWILREHQAMVFSLALNFLRNRSVAEDLAQDVFLSLYQSLSSIKSRDHLIFWLRKATVRRCVDYSRRRKVRSAASIDDIPEPSLTPPQPDVFLSRLLKRGVDALPEKARLILVLRYQEDLEPADIARVMDIPLNTVKSHLRRSLARLREELKA